MGFKIAHLACGDLELDTLSFVIRTGGTHRGDSARKEGASSETCLLRDALRLCLEPVLELVSGPALVAKELGRATRRSFFLESCKNLRTFVLSRRQLSSQLAAKGNQAGG